MVRKRFKCGRRAVVLGLVLASAGLVGTKPVEAQTLARKGWAGSGMLVDPWWKNAVFYEVDPRGGLSEIISRLDELQSLGVDAMVLSPFAVEADANGKLSFDEAYGTDEDFERLQQEASRRKMRLVVELEQTAKHPIGHTVAEARYWLTRGVGGLLLTFPQDVASVERLGVAERVQRLMGVRRLCQAFAGDRVLISETVPPEAFSGSRAANGIGKRRFAPQAREAAELTIDRRLDAVSVWNASGLQAIVFGSAPADALLESDTADGERSWSRFSGANDSAGRLAVAKMVAGVLFLGKEAPLLYSGQEMAEGAGTPSEAGDADSLLNWYRSLSKLRHERPALHGGTVDAVATGYPEVVAWVRRSRTSDGAPVLVVCNVSAQTRVVSVAEGLRRLGVSTAHGVQVLAVSDAGMSRTYSAAGITLPAYGTYVAELRQPGLEDATAPLVSRHRRR